MKLEDKKIVFADLDGTLIDTLTGETFPKGVWDVKLKLDVFAKIKEMFPNMTHFFIVTNQGGIEKGIVNGYNFRKKLEWIKAALVEWFNKPDLVVDGIVCTSTDRDNHYRKPNTGMLEDLVNHYFKTNPEKSEMIMIGDASDAVRDFSDSDKMTAQNYGIDYVDVRDFLKEK